VPLEIDHEIGDAAVVYVLVGSFQAPDLRIFGEVPAHVLVNEFLKVSVQAVAQGTDDHIGADAPFGWDITTGIIERNVGRIVIHRDANLLAGRGCDFFAGLREGYRAGEKKDKRETQHDTKVKGEFFAKQAILQKDG